MQFSEQWLRTFVDPAIDSAGLDRLLTMAGLEVEERTPVAPPFSGVVVGRIVDAQPHPNADRLRVCRVDVGADVPLQIVCGAPNAAIGLVVPCAQVGAVLPGDFPIKAAKLRGVESFGMLCSARELGLSDAHEGLLELPSDLAVGVDVRSVLLLDDVCFTIKLTPNRADCLSLLGVAREVAALTASPLSVPAVMPASVTSSVARPVDLAAAQACPRYLGRVIEGVDVSRATPEWMKRRLERCGVRPISAVVDVTNYVMLETGQPLHAFDNDRLAGAVTVRWAAETDRLALLNGNDVQPDTGTLLIADERGPLALAGVMGGAESAVGDDTRNVFLESAHFAPDAIVGRARRYGFSSDASHRFERGVDPELPSHALERATQLILDICGGAAGPVTRAELPDLLPARPAVAVRPARVAQVIGVAYEAPRIIELLRRVGMRVTERGEHLDVVPPSYRFDVRIEEDLIEEVARLGGYDAIPETIPSGALAILPVPEGRGDGWHAKALLTARDYQEVITYAFVEARWEADFCANPDPVRLANPIASHLSVMRSSLIGGLIGVLAVNQRRRATRVRVFETGRCFARCESDSLVNGFDQPPRLAALAWGPALSEQWGSPTRRVDYFDLKGDLESLFAAGTLTFEAAAHPALHPGRSARVMARGRSVGWIGELHPNWVQRYELGSAPVVFEVDLSSVHGADLPAFTAVSKFPPVVRDLALVVEARTAVAELLAVLRSAAVDIVQAVDIFDVYQGGGVEPGRKSVAIRVRFQHTERTLEDAEVDAAVATLVGRAGEQLGAQIRS